MIDEDVIKETTVKTQDRLKIGMEMKVFRRKDQVWSDGGVDMGASIWGKG